MTIRWPASLVRRTAWLACALAIALMVAPSAAFAVATGTVHGTVVDSETGEPVPDAGVFLWSWEAEDEFEAVADASGEFQIADVPVGEYGMDVYADGFEYFYDDVTVVAGDNDVTVMLVAEQPTVSGTVTGPTGSPIDEALVEAFYFDVDMAEWQTQDYQWTDTDGTWGMDMSPGVYRFGFMADGFRTEYFDNAATLPGARNVTIWPFAPATNVNAQLELTTPDISGVVTADADDAPIADAEVVLWQLDPESEDPEFPYVDVAYAMTDGAGAYHLGDLEPGSYYVSVYAEAYRPELYNDAQEFDDATPVVFSGTPVTGIDFGLMSSEVSLSGTVTDALTGDPLEEAFVETFEFDGEDWVASEFYGAWTDASGLFEFYDLPHGTYRLGHTGSMPAWPAEEDARYFGAAFWDGAATLAAATDIVVDGTQVATGYDLALPEATPSITGTVTAEGQPVADVWVDAYQFDEFDEAWYTVNGARTAEDGTYEIFGLGDAEVRVGIESQFDFENEVPYRPSFWDGKSSVTEADAVVTTAGVTVSGIDLALTPAKSIVAGTVVDEANAPVDGAMAFVAQERTEHGETGWYFVGVGEVIEGSFEVYAMEAIDYDKPVRLGVFTGGGYFPEFWNNKRTIEEATDIDVNADGPVTLGVIKLDPYTPVATRVSSDTRYSTALAMAKRFTNDWTGVEHVILASGEDRAAADPLAASGLAWAYGGAPIVLTPSGSTPAELKAAFKSIVAKNEGVEIHVVGGIKSVPQARVKDILAALGEDADSVTVDRIAGRDRFDNARLISLRMLEVRPDMPDFALVANGADATKFFDALALSSVSARTGAPILLVSANSVPAATTAALKELPLSKGKIFVAGGSKTVTPVVFKQLGITEANRLAGSTRYSTAVAVSQWAIENGWLDDAVVGVAAKLPDALSGGALVGWRGGSLLVTDGRRLSAETGAYLTELAPSLMENTPVEVYVFGGSQSVTKPVVDAINATLLGFEE